MKVTYFQRKVIPDFHFSVEIMFNDVRKHLPPNVSYSVEICRYLSRGVFPRLYNIIEAYSRRGEINHVTGDINFIGTLLPPKKTIQTILDCVYMTRSSGIKRWVYRLFWIRIPARRCRFITTISEASKAEILEHAKCPPDKVKVIPIGPSSIFRRTDRTYDWNKPRILLVGAAPNKNIPNILEALKGIRCFVRIVGQHNPDHQSFLEKNGIDHAYESGLTTEQMYERYKATDVLVFASTYEGFGMPIIEAQATGTPVVTSNISSMPEVGGVGGAVYVDPYSVTSIRAGILRVIGDPSLRAELIAQGYENVKRFDPGNISKMYLDLYEQIGNNHL